jgi:hypothetical protein
MALSWFMLEPLIPSRSADRHLPVRLPNLGRQMWVFRRSELGSFNQVRGCGVSRILQNTCPEKEYPVRHTGVNQAARIEFRKRAARTGRPRSLECRSEGLRGTCPVTQVRLTGSREYRIVRPAAGCPVVDPMDQRRASGRYLA